MNRIIFGNALDTLETLATNSIQLIYIDPPFNTGKEQKRGELTYNDVFGTSEAYIAFLAEHIRHAYRVLDYSGTLYLHCDYREAHYIKVLLDSIFGRDRFLNELIWAYDYGGKSKRKWPTKHDTIFVYTKTEFYTFNNEAVDREPYMAPGLVGPEKAALGKMPTDVWWHTIVPTNGSEKTGYPTQKPIGILRRIIQASSNKGDTVLDFFAGSGTTGFVAAANGRTFILVDNNPQAIEIMKERFQYISTKYE